MWPKGTLCITIAGFIVFYDNCRPFTRFRRILFFSVTGVIVLILYFMPEFFIISGTKILNAIDIKNNGIMSIPYYVYNHLGENAKFGLYMKMNLTQGLFLLAYAVTVYPMFLLNKKYAGKIIDRLLFSKRDFTDE